MQPPSDILRKYRKVNAFKPTELPDIDFSKHLVAVAESNALEK